MSTVHLGEVEGRFADIIWNNEPISSGELAKIAEKELSWKKSTSYTVLKRLCDRGIFKNDKGTVVSLISKEDLHLEQSRELLDEAFNGSLPAFVAAFTKKNKLSKKEALEIKELISSFEGDD